MEHVASMNKREMHTKCLPGKLTRRDHLGKFEGKGTMIL